MFCNKCGKQIPDGSKFCISCGTQVNAAPVNNVPIISEVSSPKSPSFNFGSLTNPFAGGFNQTTILKQEISMNFLAILLAVIGFICAFLPAMKVKTSLLGNNAVHSVSVISGDFSDEIFGGALVIIFMISIAIIYVLKRDNLALIVSAVNFIFSLYLLIATFSAVRTYTDSLSSYSYSSYLYDYSKLASVNVGAGVILYFIISILMMASPFIWQLIGSYVNKLIKRN